MSKGFRQVGDCHEWRSCYWHDHLQVFLIIYVDDFKMAGPETKVAEAWDLLRKGDKTIKMDELKQVENYLGCEHVVGLKVVDG